MSDFSRNVRDVDGFHVVTLSGELDIASAEGLSDWLVEISGSTVVIDLSEVTFMDSTGLTAFISARNRLRDDSVVLTRPQPNVLRVFEITGLDKWIVEWDERWAIR